MAAFLARVYVSLKPTVNDPQGLTIADGLRSLGFSGVQGVRAGKYIEIRLTATSAAAAGQEVDSMCDKLLANPIIESYRYDVEELVEP
ncbi:MAG TPA: phosphoribosylformylglycinamidine synthase subunit PurS [Dehalococcoidia bacterium]|nr:phosphoribosylformylglycinamidine synthase subunit PurS [Dehalococcoidia bacterium]